MAARHGLATRIDSPMLVGTALLLGLFLISAIVELPLGAYGQFRVEARFGFNRQTPAGFVADLVKQACWAW
jgi:STE24 endopeptidase